MSEELKLLPCPACGHERPALEDDDFSYVECVDCGLTGPAYVKEGAREAAVAAWNALPPSSSEIPNNSPAAMPVPVVAPKQLDILHKARERCRFEFLPQAYSSLDREAAERSHLANDLYKLQDCLWAALYNVCSAAARLRA